MIIKPEQNIRAILETNGYPFKSKEHSHYLAVYQHSGMTKTNYKYLGYGEKETKFVCPKCLKYQFTEEFKLKVSDKCCYKLKKDVAHKWAEENNRLIVLTGMRADEGGLRANHACTVFENGSLIKFHPLMPLNNDFIEWYIKRRNIQLCELYYSPYNFQRTGCKGCPYSLDLQKQLDIMAVLLPEEKKQCEMIWAPVYAEYRRLGYRLRSNEQLELF